MRTWASIWVLAAALAAAGIAIAVIVIADGDDKKPEKPAAKPAVDPFEAGAPFAQPAPVRIDRDRPTEIVATNTELKVNGDGKESVTVGKGQAYLARGPGATAQPARLTGPTLLARPGGTVKLRLRNELQVYPEIEGQSPADCRYEKTNGQVTNFHFHGLRVTPETRKIDGVTVYGDNVLVDLEPKEAPNKGISEIEFDIPADHEQGTFWYHAHHHGCTDDQVARGLAGLLFIGDSRRELPRRFHRITTRDLMLQDLQVVKENDGYEIDPAHFWPNPTNRLVNGLAQPKMTIAPGETQLWRIANGSAGVWFDVSLQNAPEEAPDGDDADPAGFTVVAQDGNTLKTSREVTSHVLGPGNRVDILVTGPMSGAKRVLKTLAFEQATDLTFPEDVLASVETGGAPRTPIEEPGRLKPLEPLAKRRGPNREFTFNLGPPGLASRPSPGVTFTINDQTFTHDSPAQATPTLGTTERWTVRNVTNQLHPFHIHQGDFRVVSVNGKPVDNGGQQDVVALPFAENGKPGEVVFDMTFREEGDFVFHCHILDHEDFGMMARVSVTDGK